MPNGNLKRFLLGYNQERSKLYTSPDASLERRKHRKNYPTEVCAFKCSDGRLNLPIMTNTPPGIILPFRNIGGVFDVGWPYLGLLLLEFVEFAVKERGQHGLPIVTYHWSKGNNGERGCRGLDYDVTAARNYTRRLRGDIRDIFGKRGSVIYPIQMGLETDEDAILLHGNNGDSLDISTTCLEDADEFLRAIGALFPDMPLQIRKDLVPLLVGNLSHVKKVRASGRKPEEAQHKEQILAIGRGFDWLHLPNKALIVGPYSYDLATPIATAAGILRENLLEGRIPKDEGIVLLAAATFRDETGPERTWAANKAESLANFALKVIRERVPEIEPDLEVLIGTTNLNTRLFTENHKE